MTAMDRLKSLLKSLAPHRSQHAAAGDPVLPAEIIEIQSAWGSAVDAESALAYRHTSDPYFTSDGHDVGRDETVAILYAQRIDLTPTASELADSALYADRLLSDLEAIKRDYRSSEDDPEGYGIGTLHSLSRALAPFRRA